MSWITSKWLMGILWLIILLLILGVVYFRQLIRIPTEFLIKSVVRDNRYNQHVLYDALFDVWVRWTISVCFFVGKQISLSFVESFILMISPVVDQNTATSPAIPRTTNCVNKILRPGVGRIYRRFCPVPLKNHVITVTEAVDWWTSLWMTRNSDSRP